MVAGAVRAAPSQTQYSMDMGSRFMIFITGASVTWKASTLCLLYTSYTVSLCTTTRTNSGRSSVPMFRQRGSVSPLMSSTFITPAPSRPAQRTTTCVSLHHFSGQLSLMRCFSVYSDFSASCLPFTNATLSVSGVAFSTDTVDFTSITLRPFLMPFTSSASYAVPSARVSGMYTVRSRSTSHRIGSKPSMDSTTERSGILR